VTGAKQDTATLSNLADGPDGWAPRLVQQTRLRVLEDTLKGQPVGDDIIAIEIERAILLGALDRRAEAQQTFIDILRRAPRNFSALNEFGTLLAAMGAIDAACRVYAEAILHHPGNPMGHVNLANLLLRANRHAEARVHYEAVLQTYPDHAEAHQGLGAVLSDLGDRAAARYHFQKGFRDHAISTLPYRGGKPPVTLLQLVSSGGGNIPTSAVLDDCTFLTSVIVADYLDPSTGTAAAPIDLQCHRRCRPLRARAGSGRPPGCADHGACHQRSLCGAEDRPYRQCPEARRLARRDCPADSGDGA